MNKPAKLETWMIRQRQGMSLDLKVKTSLLRIVAWYEYFNGDVYVAFSGGKDSTVMLNLVRSIYPKVPAVFCDTGLEFPEIKQFIRETPNVITLRPKLSFREVLDKYGYPLVSKEQAQYIEEIRNSKSDKLIKLRLEGNNKGQYILKYKWRYLLEAPFKISAQCCLVMKKRPSHFFERETGLKPFIGLLADDSRLRDMSYRAHGCNVFNLRRPTSRPIMFWLEEDIWNYLKLNNVPYSPIYDMGYDRTGCIFCLFGLHMEESTSRFDRMKKTHPKLYTYCMNKLGLKEVLEWYPVRKE